MSTNPSKVYRTTYQPGAAAGNRDAAPIVSFHDTLRLAQAVSNLSHGVDEWMVERDEGRPHWIGVNAMGTVVVTIDRVEQPIVLGATA
jgi:hypothetical protein